MCHFLVDVSIFNAFYAIRILRYAKNTFSKITTRKMGETITTEQSKQNKRMEFTEKCIGTDY